MLSFFNSADVMVAKLAPDYGDLGDFEAPKLGDLLTIIGLSLRGDFGDFPPLFLAWPGTICIGADALLFLS